MWTKENTTVLITLYEQYPNLYQVRNPNYKSKTKRRLCLQKISDDLNSQCTMETTADIISKKINGLRTTFKQEVNKIKKSKASGVSTDDIYQPSWWCFEFLLFLWDSSAISPGESNLNVEETNETEVQETQEEFESQQPQAEIVLFDDNISSPSLLSLKPTYYVQKIKEKEEGLREPPRKKNKNSSENDFFKNVKEALTTICSKEAEHDHIHTFAQHVESELRLIKDKNKLKQLKAKISQLIFDAEED